MDRRGLVIFFLLSLFLFVSFNRKWADVILCLGWQPIFEIGGETLAEMSREKKVSWPIPALTFSMA